MMPGSYPLSLYRGDSAHWVFKLWQDTDKTLPVDLTGATAKSEIRDKPGGTVNATLDCDITLPNIIDVDLTAIKSGALPTTPLQWDLQITYASGEVTTIAAGAVKVTADITDSTATLTLAARRA